MPTPLSYALAYAYRCVRNVCSYIPWVCQTCSESDQSKSQSITKLAAQLWNFLRDQGDLGSAQLSEDDEELVRAAFAAAQAGNNTTFTSIVPPTIITRSPSDIPSPTRMEQCKKYIAELRDLAQRMSKLYGVETLAFIVPRYQDVSPATKATVHSIGGLRFIAHCNDFKNPSGASLLSTFASEMSWDETLKANKAADLKEGEPITLGMGDYDLLQFDC